MNTMTKRVVKLEDAGIEYREDNEARIWLHLIEEPYDEEVGKITHGFYVTVAEDMFTATMSAAGFGKVIKTVPLTDALAALEQEEIEASPPSGEPVH